MFERLFGRKVWIASGALLSLASSSLADIIYLRDGTWIRGTIVRESKDELEIHGKTDSGIDFKGTIKQAQVNSIIRTDTPAPATPDTTTPADPAKTDTKEKAKEQAGDFLVVPLKGTFGEDIYPKGVADAIKWAGEKGVRTIVFTIESPGGQVWAAEAIQDLIKDNADKFTFHIIIKEAISASIWVVFSCEKIAVTPGGTLGAAVAFRRGSAGNAEVDEKFNSAIAAKLASYAERRGHSGELVRAMVLTDQKLFAVKSARGWAFAHDKPADTKLEVDTLNDGNRVVTLTADQMAKYKVATKILGSSDTEIAEFLGDGKLKSAGARGEQIMRSASQATTSVVKQIQKWAEGVDSAAALWRSAAQADDVNRAIEATENYLKQLRRIGELRTKAKELGMLAYPLLKRIDVEAAVREAEADLLKLKELRRNRQNQGR